MTLPNNLSFYLIVALVGYTTGQCIYTPAKADYNINTYEPLIMIQGDLREHNKLLQDQNRIITRYAVAMERQAAAMESIQHKL